MEAWMKLHGKFKANENSWSFVHTILVSVYRDLWYRKREEKYEEILRGENAKGKQ